MKKNLKLTLVLLFPGLILSAVALSAEAIGLDRNPGAAWGRARTACFVIGVCLVLGAGLYFWLGHAIRSQASKFIRLVQELPALAWLWNHKHIRTVSTLIRNYSFTLPVVVFVLAAYAWLVSSGTWTDWTSPTRYYASLAKGFEYHSLSVMMKPDPRLAELENPYDPVNWRRKIPVPMDISYYKGRFYLYWGPAPAFLLYLIHPIYSGRIGDLDIAFLCVCGIFICQYLLLIHLWDRYFSALPKWMLQMSLLLSGLACPWTFMLAPFKGARIYEAAISSGQFFFLAGFLVAVTSLNKPAVSACVRLLIAGLLWSLSFGSRMPLVLPVAIMAIMVFYWFYQGKQRLSLIALKLFFLGLSLSIGLASIGWYNWARFGSVTEAGLKYQLTAGLYLQKYNKDLMHLIYIPQNIYNYIFYPFDVSARFPFFAPRHTYAVPIFSFYPLPELYSSGQWMSGFLWTVPFVFFSLIPLVVLWKKPRPLQYVDDEQKRFNWLVLALAGGFIGAFGFLLVFFWAAMRYQADFMPCLLMLGIVGFWQGYQWLAEKPAWRGVYSMIGATVAVISMINGILLALAVNDARFLILNIFQ